MNRPLFINMGGVRGFSGDLSLLEGNTPIFINRGLLIRGQHYKYSGKPKFMLGNASATSFQEASLSRQAEISRPSAGLHLPLPVDARRGGGDGPQGIMWLIRLRLMLTLLHLFFFLSNGVAVGDAQP